MELQLVSKKVAILAKKLGFDWNCYHAYEKNGIALAFNYNGEIRFTPEDIENAKSNGYECQLAPEQEVLAKWLRDVYKIYIYCWPQRYVEEIVWYNTLSKRENKFFKTYEEAMEDGLLKSLDYLRGRLANPK